MSVWGRYTFLTATLCFFAALCVLLSLGRWQLQRLNWKERLIQQAGIETPLTYEKFEEGFKRYQADAETLFYPIQVSGTFFHDFAFRVGPRTHRGKSGYHVITPLLMEDGKIIFVNRGWVADHPSKPILSPQGSVSLKGLLSYPDKPGLFTPDNEPCKDIWYYIDVEQMRQRLKQKGFQHGDQVLSLYVLAQDQDQVEGIYPVAVDLKYALRNPHLGYAITWFGLAGVLICFYMTFVRKWFCER